MKEDWVTSETKLRGEVIDVEPYIYQSEYGNKYRITKKQENVEVRLFGFKVCANCGKDIPDEKPTEIHGVCFCSGTCADEYRANGNVEYYSPDE